VWFSWWEKRKIELLQAKLLEPKYIILDEIDSGLDIDAFKVVVNLISKLNNENNSIIMITHQFNIIKYINFDKVYVLKDGKVDKSWGNELVEEILKKGFE
jgi:Fe-S cluster assembly ATP-binding protein